MQGKFIAFEGIDGCGKTSQAARLARALEHYGVPVVETREPGGSTHGLSPWIGDTVGGALRDIILGPVGAELTPLSRAFLFAADRAQHVHDVIAPAIDAGKTVVCDRYRLSTFVYQTLDGMPFDVLRTINDIACQGYMPDCYILLDVPVRVAQPRATDRNYFEQHGPEYQEQALQTYLGIHGRESNVHVIDGTQDEARVADDVWAVVCSLWGWAPIEAED